MHIVINETPNGHILFWTIFHQPKRVISNIPDYCAHIQTKKIKKIRW